MRRSLFLNTSIVVVAMISASASATAADLPASWSGFYLGANAGYGSSARDGAHIVRPGGIIVDPDVFNKLTLDGFAGGGTIGYNYQMGGVVLGVEGDFDFLNAHDSRQLNTAYFDRLSTSIDWLATARVRAGYTFGPALVYATGGAAFAKFESDEFYSFPGYGTISDSETKIGFAVGGGVEYVLTANLSMKTEYLYADFGKQSFDITANAFLAGTTAQIDHALHIARVGLNF